MEQAGVQEIPHQTPANGDIRPQLPDIPPRRGHPPPERSARRYTNTLGFRLVTDKTNPPLPARPDWFYWKITI